MSNNSWTVAEPTTIDVPGRINRLEVALARGRVDVVAGDGPVRVEVHAVEGRPLEVSTQHGELKVGYRGSSMSGFVDRVKSLGTTDSADVQITCPSDVALTLGVVKADGLVAGLRGDLKVSTVSGPLVVDQCAGPLKASTVSGGVVVRDHAGTAVVSSVSGHLTVSGEVTDLKASVVSGDLTADLTVAPRAAKLSAVSGDVVLRVPDAASLLLRLSAASGRVTVDGVEHVDPHHKGVALGLTLRDAGAATISTVSGDVTVLSRDLPAAEAAGAAEAGEDA